MLVQEFKERSGISARFRTAGKVARIKIAKEKAMTVYRIVQESLNNVEKHSKAKLVEVTLSADAGQLGLNVRDNGKGIGDRRGGSGLQNMAERAAMLSGQLSVNSALGKGTRITVNIPLSKWSHE